MFDACGCGCCGAPVLNRCYYPDLGQSLAVIKAQDHAVRTDPGCAAAGCASGVHYVRCETPDVEAGATYGVIGFSDNKMHLRVNRSTLSGRCSAMTSEQPGTTPEGYPLELPGQYGLTPGLAQDRPCNGMSTSPVRGAIGALGFMKQSAPHSCAYDFDFTLFFLAGDGTADAARFKAEGVALPGMASGTCP
jgi:hypothetical protein